MAANANEDFSQHRPQNRSIKDGALAVIGLDFYLLALGAFGCFELVQDAMQLAAN
jgi:hypothetical protein